MLVLSLPRPHPRLAVDAQDDAAPPAADTREPITGFDDLFDDPLALPEEATEPLPDGGAAEPAAPIQPEPAPATAQGFWF